MKQSVIDFTRQLSMLMKSGIPLLKSLETVYEQMPHSKMQKVLAGIIEDIREGEFLSEALEHKANVFPQIYINMVKAGEISGKLSASLKELSEFLVRSRRLKQKVVSSVMYPLLILITAVVILFVLMVFVVPSLSQIFKDLGGELPPMTKFLVNSANFLGKWGYLVVIGLIGLGFFYVLFRRTAKGAYKINVYRWKLPIIGTLFKSIALERFCHSLGVMLSSGVSLVSSLLATKEVVISPLLKEAIDNIIVKVEEGATLSESIESAGVFPVSLVRIVNVAEEGGRVSEVFLDVSCDYEEEISSYLTGVISLLEPLLIIFMGAVVGFIVISLFFPIFTIGGLLQ